MEPNKIVIHFKDGSLLKGNTSDFFQNKKSFHLHLLDGQVKEIEVEALKSVFFVKDLAGDSGYVYEYNHVVAGGGKKVAVDFPDGEKVIGYVLGYSPQRQGFMLTPADLDGNNERIFIVNSATRSVNFLSEEHALPKEAKPEIPKPESEDVHPEKKSDKRRHPRITSVNLISYVCFDEDRRPLEQGMGKTLDMGLGGLLMETSAAIQAKYVLLMTINLREELIKIKGRVVHSREIGSSVFHTGIRFVEKNEKIREIITDMIKVFMKTKAE